MRSFAPTANRLLALILVLVVAGTASAQMKIEPSSTGGGAGGGMNTNASNSTSAAFGNLVSGAGIATARHALGLDTVDSPTFTGLTLSGLGAGTLCVHSTNGILGVAAADCGTGSGITQLTGGVTAGPGSGSQAATVVTNANLTGPITSVGNATSIASQTGTGTKFVVDTSPTLAGTPLAPTAAAGTNTTQISTTAFVKTAVDNAIAGVNPAVAVQAATTAAGDTSGLTYNNGVAGIGATLTGSINTALTVDGYTFTAVNQRLLVKNDTQSPSGAFNGVYYVTQVQTVGLPPILTRALDYDMPSDINNTGAIPVINGTANGTTTWVITSAVTTVGTDPLTYVKFSIAPSDVATLSDGQTFTGAKTFTAAAPQLILGVNTTTLGSIKMFGNTSGDLTINPAAVAGTASVATFPANTGTVAELNLNQAWTAGQAVTPDTATQCGTQSAAGTMTPNFALSNSCVATFGAGNLTIANPTNVKAGQSWILSLTQDGTGSRTVTWGSQYKWASGTAPTLSTAASSKDVISCFSDTTTTHNCTLAVKGAS